ACSPCCAPAAGQRRSSATRLVCTSAGSPRSSPSLNPGHRRTISVEGAVNASTAGSGGQLVVAGAGYAGLHVALRLAAKLRGDRATELVLIDRHDYHQVMTELPRVAGGTRAAGAVRIPLEDMLAARVRFVRTEINGFDLPGRRLLTGAGPVGWRRL